MGKTYRQMQRDIKEYREKHPEFWCKVNVNYEDMIKLHQRMLKLQEASVDTTEKPALTKESKITQINIPVVQIHTVPVYSTTHLP